MNYQEEFLESEIIFSDSDYDSDLNPGVTNSNVVDNGLRFELLFHSSGSNLNLCRKAAEKVVPCATTSPVDIQAEIADFSSKAKDFGRPTHLSVEWLREDRELDDDDDEDVVEMLPPHLIVARRNVENRLTAEAGLRGRNMYERRNSILRMTGFLER